MDEVRLDEQVAIVTGAGQGLGRSHALALAQRGARTVVNDLGVGLDGRKAGSSARDVVREIEALGGVAVEDGNSIATPEGGEALVQTAIDAFGRVDIVVQNAGFLRDGTMAKLSVDSIERVLEVHLMGAFWTIQPAWRHFRDQGYGRIITTTSVAGLLGNFGQANYSAAKMGLVGLTRTLAIEGARYGITANAISPAARTRMTEALLGDKLERLDPALVSPLVVWLSSENCTTSGEVFSVGAGRVARVIIGQSAGVIDPDLTPEILRKDWDEIVSGGFVAEPRNVDEDFALMFGGHRDSEPT